MRNFFKIKIIVLFVVLVLGWGAAVYAQGSSSPNYRLDESFIGPGGTIESNSSNYGLEGSLGDTGVGESSSTAYEDQAGYNTTSDPRLSFVVNSASVDFGNFSTGSAQTATSTFSVLNYTSHGYLVQAYGPPPSSGSHTLAGMSSTASSAAGTEQFGINLVANTNPASFGADPVQVPSGSFSFGQVAANYNTANQYRYVSGETVAQSVESSGQTDFTISYIVNVASTTPGGSYSGNQELICIGTY